MPSSETPQDQSFPTLDGVEEKQHLRSAADENNVKLPTENNDHSLFAPASEASADFSGAQNLGKLPRRLRRRVARERAKTEKRSRLNATPSQSASSSDEWSPKEFQSYLLARVAAAYRNFRNNRADRAVTSPEAVIKPGLVIVRGEGEPNDDLTMLSVFPRISRWCGAHDEIAVCMLDGIVYDTLPIIFRDPFEELRASPFTCASASEEVFANTVSFYSELLARVSRTLSLCQDDHLQALLNRVREAAGADAWKYPSDTPPLSMLAQRVLLYVFHCVHDADANSTIEDVRRLVEHGRFLELVDPRDGAV
jgi:hypothetical protein